MGVTTNISWCDHTFNPWRGCAKVATGCENCYAETLSHRNPGTLGIWGTEAQGATRVLASEAMWKEPVKWNWALARRRVFCASLCDVFEDWQGPMVDSKGRPLFTINGEEWFTEAEYPDCRPLTMNDIRRNLFDLIDATPNLDWLLLTKRPENVRGLLPSKAGRRDYILDGKPNIDVWHRSNVWLGTSVAAQADVGENVPALLGCRDMAAKLFVSVEPLVGRVDLRPWIGKLNWVIVGGEGGPNARPCHVDWIRSLVEQCWQAGVACHVKQLGANPVHGNQKHPKGGDPSEWPEDLQIQEFPVT